MNIDPDKVKNLILLFSDLDEEYQKELMTHAQMLSFKQSQKRILKREKRIFKNEEDLDDEIETKTKKRLKEINNLLEVFEQIDDTDKATLTLLLNKLSGGKMTKDTDIQIVINQKNVSIKDYLEDILPGANYKLANQKATEHLKEMQKTEDKGKRRN